MLLYFPLRVGKKQTLGQCGDHVSVKMMTLGNYP